MSRTQKEISEKIKNDDDRFGFLSDVLLPYLEVENVKDFLKPDADLSDWKVQPQDLDAIKTKMRDYMEFAWEKAIDCRGLSAMRSINKFRAYLWLLENEKLTKFCNQQENYSAYGKPMLAEICKEYDFSIPPEAYPLDQETNDD